MKHEVEVSKVDFSVIIKELFGSLSLPTGEGSFREGDNRRRLTYGNLVFVEKD